MFRIHEVKLSPGEDQCVIGERISSRLGISVEVKDFQIMRESIDARDKGDIKFVYTVDFSVNVEDEDRIEALMENKPKGLKLEKAPDMRYEYPKPGNLQMENRPVIAGFGPCGIFAALILSEQGYRPLVIERGKPAAERIKDVELFWNQGTLNEESNVQFGEGGAGTFSDGKLATGIKDIRIRKVLEEFVSAGAYEDILYKQKPHIGTDVLRDVVVNMRKKIISSGGEIWFESKLSGLIFSDAQELTAVNIKTAGEDRTIKTEHLVLAIGHSARDTFRKLNGLGVVMEQKPFSIGVRIEHPQSLINRSQYGNAKGLPAADYKLAHHCRDGRGVYTFCMCPGGSVIVASSAREGLVVNGMSNRSRDGAYANSGLLVDVRTSDFGSDDPLAGIDFQEKYERLAFQNGGGGYIAPKCTWQDFAQGSEAAAPVRDSLPEFAKAALQEAMPALARKLKGFDSPFATITAVESRSSAPVRIKRNENFQCNIKGVYPGGEGAGYAGGIVSAAIDGMKIAEEIVKNYTKPKK